MKKSTMWVKTVSILIALPVVFSMLAGCGATKTVTCDGCGKPQEIEADSNMDDSWIIYCDECYTEFFGEEGLVP